MNNLKKEIEKMIGDTKQAKENTWNKMKKPPTKNRIPLMMMVSSTGILCFLLFIMYSSKFDGFNSQQSPIDIEAKLINGQQKGMEVPWKLLEEKKDLPIYIDAQDSAILIENEVDYEYYNDLFQFQNNGFEINFANVNLLIITFNTNSCGLQAEEFVQKNEELQITLNLPVNLRSENFIACDDLSVPNAQIYIINKTDVKHVKLIKEEEEIFVPINELEIQQNIYDFEMLYTNDVAKATLTSIGINTSPDVTNRQTLQEIQRIILEATEVPGIVDMANPNYRILFENPLGESFSVFLWLPEEDGEAVISSSRNTHTIYTIPKEMALQLLTLSEVENPFK